MDLNSPLFDRIRIKPTSEEPREAEGPACEHPGCKHEAPCCLSGPQEIRFVRTRLATAAVSSV